jgi:hypothetical protein
VTYKVIICSKSEALQIPDFENNHMITFKLKQCQSEFLSTLFLTKRSTGIYLYHTCSETIGIVLRDVDIPCQIRVDVFGLNQNSKFVCSR